MSDTYLNAAGLSTLVENIEQLTDLSGSGNNSTAVAGSGTALANFTGATAVGHNSYAYTNASAFGCNAHAGLTQNNGASIYAASGSVAIGTNAACNKTGALAIGANSLSDGLASCAVGQNANAVGSYSVAVAFNSNASAYNAVAIGRNSVASANNAVAIGCNITCDVANATTIGGKGGVYITASNGDWQIPLIEVGDVTISPTAANTPTSATVNFANAFSTVPHVVATPYTTLPGTKVLGVGISTVTVNGFDLYLTRTNTDSTKVHWAAIGY